MRGELRGRLSDARHDERHGPNMASLYHANSLAIFVYMLAVFGGVGRLRRARSWGRRGAQRGVL